MVPKEQVLSLLVHVASVYGLLKRNVLYKGVSYTTSISPSDRIACASVMADSFFMAVKIKDSTGFCGGLTWSWGSTPQYEDGYSYFEKKTTEEEYNPPWLIDMRTGWLLPCRFGVGGRLDFYMTPTSDSNAIYITLVDTAELTFNVHDDAPEEVLAYMVIKRGVNRVKFKEWQDGWQDKSEDSPYPFTESVTYKVSFVHNATDNLKILLEDRESENYYHQASMEAKQISFGIGNNNTLKINRLICNGV